MLKTFNLQRLKVTTQDGAANDSLRGVVRSFFMFLLVCPVFSYIPAISFTRDELLDIRKYTPPDISLDYVYSDLLLDNLVGGAAVLFRRFRTCRWGERAGGLVKLRRRGWRTPLPSIHLANLRSLPNKMDKLLLLSRLNKVFQTLLLCVSRNPGWMAPFQTARFIFRTFSQSDLIVTQNQRGNRVAARRAFTSMRGDVQM